MATSIQNPWITSPEAIKLRKKISKRTQDEEAARNKFMKETLYNKIEEVTGLPVQIKVKKDYGYEHKADYYVQKGTFSKPVLVRFYIGTDPTFGEEEKRIELDIYNLQGVLDKKKIGTLYNEIKHLVSKHKKDMGAEDLNIKIER